MMSRYCTVHRSSEDRPARRCFAWLNDVSIPHGEECEFVSWPLCEPCSNGEHDRCGDLGEYTRACGCDCAGIVNCPTCGHDVVLFADDDDNAVASAHCCTWAWHDSFDGCVRLDLSDGAS